MGEFGVLRLAMDCNRDEAVKAMQLSEKKIHSKDFKGAKEMALKAQRLYPQLDNIARLVAVCEVQCAAEKKVGGSEMDWYGILQVQQSDDVETIKKQYRKFTPLLHPDKTSLTGAEAAFKLIGEAYRVLYDQGSRSKYDIKYSSLLGNRTRSFGQQSSINLFGPGFSTATSSVPQSRHTSVNLQQPLNVQQPVQPDTIKIACPSCKRMYDYNFANRLIFCQRCLGISDASDLGKEYLGNQSASHGAAPSQAPQSTGQTGTMPSTTIRNGNATSKTGNVAEADSEAIVSIKSLVILLKSVIITTGDLTGICVIIPFLKLDNVGEVHADGDANVGCSEAKETTSASVTKRKRVNGSADAGVYRSTVLALVAMDKYKKFSKPRMGRKKRCTSGIELKVEESSLEDCNGSESMANGSGSKFTVDKNCRCSMADGNDRKFMAEDNNSSKSMAEDNKGSKSMAGNNGSKSVISMQKIKKVPESEFQTFALSRAELQRTIKANQTWVLYDPADGMPRRYACVKKILKPGFKVKITWLEPDPDDQGEVDWCSKKLPIACGKFRYDHTKDVTDHTMFSHEYIHSTKGKGKNSFQIYPRKGETWALYRDWDLGCSSEPEKHSQYKFDFVELLSDFSERSGAGVSYLDKVKGFVSLFESAQQNGILRSQLSVDQLYRFSHQIPSHKMTGREGYDVPANSFEFDPAALPVSVFDRRSTVTIAKPSGFIPSGRARPSAKKVKNDPEWVEDNKKGNLNGEPIVID